MTVYNGQIAGGTVRRNLYAAAALTLGISALSSCKKPIPSEPPPPPNNPPEITLERRFDDPESGEIEWYLEGTDSDGNLQGIEYKTHADADIVRTNSPTASVVADLVGGVNKIEAWAKDDSGARSSTAKDSLYIPSEEEARDSITHIINDAGPYASRGFSAVKGEDFHFIDETILADVLVTLPDGRNAVIMYTNADEDHSALVDELEATLGPYIPFRVIATDELDEIKQATRSFLDGLI